MDRYDMQLLCYTNISTREMVGHEVHCYIYPVHTVPLTLMDGYAAMISVSYNSICAYFYYVYSSLFFCTTSETLATTLSFLNLFTCN